MSLTRKLKKSETPEAPIEKTITEQNGKEEIFDVLFTWEALQQFELFVDANLPGKFARPLAQAFANLGKKMPRAK